MFRSRLPLLVLSSALAVPIAVRAQLRLGNELQVNTSTVTNQSAPAVAAGIDGTFIVAWYSYHTGNGTDVFARRFSSAGVPLASELLVNSYTTGFEFTPSVGIAANGDFVIAWESRDQDGDADGNFARRFSSAGVALGVEFQVTTYTVGYQDLPIVAVAPGGDFVIAWHARDQDGSDYGVFAQRFSSAGAFLAGEFQVNLYTPNDQRDTSIAADADGDFVIAWNSVAQDGASTGVFARRFSSAGVPLTGEIQVNTYTEAEQRLPAVAARGDGDFVVAWQSDLQDGEVLRVFVRRFSSAGVPSTGDVQMNVHTPLDQRNPTIAADGRDGFVVAWQSLTQDGSDDGVFARRLSAGGSALATELQVNSFTAAGQYNPAVAADADGRFIVVWQSVAQDGSGFGVFGQRFAVAAPVDVDGDGLARPLTDGLLILRYLFGFTGNTLITGAVGAGCTRCDAPSIEAYLAGLTG